MEFGYAGGGLGKGGKVPLYTDRTMVGGGEIPATLAMIFSADDGLDVGEDGGAPVSQDYGARERIQRPHQGSNPTIRCTQVRRAPRTAGRRARATCRSNGADSMLRPSISSACRTR